MASRKKTTPETPTEGLPRSIGRAATRALNLAGYTRLKQLAGAGEDALLALHGVGPKAIRELNSALGQLGLSLASGKKPRK